jgi:hypothetical protein
MTETTKTATVGAANPAEEPAAAGEGPVVIRETFDALALSGGRNERFARRLAEQIAGCQWLPDYVGQGVRSERVTAAVAALKELAPRNAAEALLAGQMVATHNASLDLMTRAVGDRTSVEAMEANARLGVRLMSLYVRQMELLARQRGRQRQTVRIEHVRAVDDGRVTVRAEEEQIR